MASTKTDQRVALVTGGGRRIGLAIAEAFAARGMPVVIHASKRSLKEAKDAAALLCTQGARVAAISADLADAREASGLIAAASEIFGPLAVLVNSASLFENDDAASFDPGLFGRHMAVNLRAPLILARDFAKQARAGADAVIVNIVDQRVLASNPLYFSYSLSKAGLRDATRTLAQAFAPRVRVNAVAPGPVLPNAHEGRARFDAEVAEVLLEKPVPIEAIAEAVLYLATAKNVTGQTIAVDSGQHLGWKTPDVLAALGKI